MSVSELTLEQEYFLIREHNKKLCEEVAEQDAKIEKLKNEIQCHIKVGVEYGKIIAQKKVEIENIKLEVEQRESLYKHENEKLKAQLQVAVDALEFYAFNEDYAREALAQMDKE